MWERRGRSVVTMDVCYGMGSERWKTSSLCPRTKLIDLVVSRTSKLIITIPTVDKSSPDHSILHSLRNDNKTPSETTPT